MPNLLWRRPAPVLLAIIAALLLLPPGAAAEDKAPTESKQDVPYQIGTHDAITDVPGVTVGHYTHTEGTMRGTTVIFPGETGGVCAVEVRGSNPQASLHRPPSARNATLSC
jgi:hypothetical protein